MRAAALFTALALVALPPASAEARRHSRVVIGGGFVWDPFWYPPPPPYPYRYWGPYPGCPPPSRPERERPPEREESDEDARRTTYGLIQLRGAPEGAAVDLDGRLWLRARRLDDRWLALPQGPHTITVRPRGGGSVRRDVEIEAGEPHVLHFAPTGRR